MEIEIQRMRLEGAYWLFVGFKDDSWLDLGESIVYIIRKVKGGFQVHRFNSHRWRANNVQKPIELVIPKCLYKTQKAAIDNILLKLTAEAI